MIETKWISQARRVAAQASRHAAASAAGASSSTGMAMMERYSRSSSGMASSRQYAAVTGTRARRISTQRAWAASSSSFGRFQLNPKYA
jgi:hypothetical protein